MNSREDVASYKDDVENYNHQQDIGSVQRLRRGSVDSRKSFASRVSLAESTNTMPPPPSPGVPPKLPEPLFDDSSLTFEQILADSKLALGEDDPEDTDDRKETVDKRASNVLRLAQENEKLNAELNALSERLRATEEKAKALEERKRQRERESASTGSQGSSPSSG